MITKKVTLAKDFLNEHELFNNELLKGFFDRKSV